jgi:hypothetical protein
MSDPDELLRWEEVEAWLTAGRTLVRGPGLLRRICFGWLRQPRNNSRLAMTVQIAAAGTKRHL